MIWQFTGGEDALFDEPEHRETVLIACMNPLHPNGPNHPSADVLRWWQLDERLAQHWRIKRWGCPCPKSYWKPS